MSVPTQERGNQSSQVLSFFLVNANSTVLPLTPFTRGGKVSATASQTMNCFSDPVRFRRLIGPIVVAWFVLVSPVAGQRPPPDATWTADAA